MALSLRSILCQLLIGIVLTSPSRSLGQTLGLPVDGGQVNVKLDYGAVCDGVTDDTAAFLRAIEDARSNRLQAPRIIFVPTGTCVVRDQLPWRDVYGSWQQNLSLVGAGIDRSIIRLVDRAAGFQDPGQPRAVVYTASKVEAGDPPIRNLDGSGNKAFHNHISDLTIDIGRDNPGAVGIDFLASNVGSIRNVRVRSASRSGYAGIRMERYGPGPALLSRVTIDGFDYGIRIAHLDYGITLEHVSLYRQNVVGIHNSGNVLSIRKLGTSGSVPAIDNATSNGLVVLLDSSLQGGAPGSAAIRNSGKLLLRNVGSSGYAAIVSGTGPSVSRFVSHGPYSAFEQDLRTTLSLPIEETPPSFHSTKQSDWANVAKYGAIAADGLDDSAGFQAAMSSGKPIVYAPSGAYHFARSVQIPGSVRLVHLAGSSLQPVAGTFADPGVPSDLLVVQESSPNSVSLVRFWAAGFQGTTVLRQASTRVVIVKDAGLGGAGRIEVEPHAGKVFLEDSGAGSLHIGAGARVWARQLNLEARSPVLQEMSINDGGALWVLGLKTEAAKPVNRTRARGCTEILGGLIYAAQAVPPDVSMFEIVDGFASFTYAETAYAEQNRYTVHVTENRSGAARSLLRTSLPLRGLGSVVALGSAQPDTCPPFPR